MVFCLNFKTREKGKACCLNYEDNFNLFHEALIRIPCVYDC